MPKQLGNITIYSFDELSTELSISVQTLNRYRKQAILSAKKIGHDYYVTEENLKKFLNAES